GHVADESHEALVVDLVERRVDLIEDAERRRLVAEDREQQRQRGQGPLAAGEQRDRLVLLAGRLRRELDAALQYVLLVEQLHPGRAAAEERREDLAEVDVHRREGLAEQLAR